MAAEAEREDRGALLRWLLCALPEGSLELPAGAGEALEKGEACSFEVDWDERGRVRAVDVMLRETDAYWAG